MNKHLRIFLVISLLINALGLVGVVYIKHKSIEDRLASYSILNGEPKPTGVKAFNRTEMPNYIELCGKEGDAVNLKVLLIGNSMLYHPAAAAVGWNHDSGMAASSADQDYAHLIFQDLQDAGYGKVCVRTANVVKKFEWNIAAFDADLVADLVSFKPDVVVFQLGDNVSITEEAPSTRFEKSYRELINAFKKDNKKVVTICALPFWASPSKNVFIENVAMSTGSFVVDLSHLSQLQAVNVASKDTTITAKEKALWKNSKIGIHPGNIGMANIARQFLIAIKAGLATRAN